MRQNNYSYDGFADEIKNEEKRNSLIPKLPAPSNPKGTPGVGTKPKTYAQMNKAERAEFSRQKKEAQKT